MIGKTQTAYGEARWVLGIDFGTTYTCAAVSEGGRVRELRIDGHSRLPSAVFLDDDGRILVGQAAESRAPLAPERFEPTPKRYLEAGADGILLGDRYLRLQEVVGAVLRIVWQEALLQHEGRRPHEVRLTHPASWQQERRGMLREAAAEAGIPEPVLLPEPEAAAVFLARELGEQSLGQGALIAVFDLGGGTFDTAVMRRTGNRFRMIGEAGGEDHIGGELFDHHLYDELGNTGLDPDEWQRLQTSDEAAWSRANFEFRRQVRAAKEAVSRSAAQPLLVPAPVSRELQVTRDGLENLIRADVERTLDTTETTLKRAGVALSQLSAVYLVGGSSRIPLVQHMVRERFGRADFKGDPKAVVAQGAVAFDSALVSEPAAPATTNERKRPWWAIPAAGTVVALVIALVVILLKGGTDHVAGQVVDSRGEPLANLEILIRPNGSNDDGREYRTVTDEDGRFEIAAKKDPEDSKQTQPTEYSAIALFEWKGAPNGIWRFDLAPDPDNVGNADDLRFQAKVSGATADGDPVLPYHGATVQLFDHLASTSVYAPEANSVIGYYGEDAVVTVHFTPRGRLVDGTTASSFSKEVQAGDLFMGDATIGDIPCGRWLVSAEVRFSDGTAHPLAFEDPDGSGRLYDQWLLTFGTSPPQEVLWLALNPETQATVAPAPSWMGA
jgi:molecular chaperone DnaK (HSP70)